MIRIQNKISYLRGLAAGMDITESSKEGKVIIEIINVLEEMSDSILDLEDNQYDLEEYIEAVDEDLDDLEEEIYDDEDFDCCCDFDDDDFITLDEDDM